MSRITYKPTPVDFKRPGRKSETIPSQSLTIREILTRYTRGVGVDVKQHQSVYLDQDEDDAIDFERVNRLDFSEKAELAQTMARKAQNIKEAFEASQAQAAADQQEHAPEAHKRLTKEKSEEAGERATKRQAPKNEPEGE